MIDSDLVFKFIAASVGQVNYPISTPAIQLIPQIQSCVKNFRVRAPLPSFKFLPIRLNACFNNVGPSNQDTDKICYSMKTAGRGPSVI